MASGEAGRISPCTPKGRAKRKDGACRCKGWTGCQDSPEEGRNWRGSLRATGQISQPIEIQSIRINTWELTVEKIAD